MSSTTTADPGAPTNCDLRDTITAANTKLAMNGCNAGSGDDDITFNVPGGTALVTLGSIAARNPEHSYDRRD